MSAHLGLSENIAHEASKHFSFAMIRLYYPTRASSIVSSIRTLPLLNQS